MARSHRLRQRVAFWKDAMKGGGERLVWIIGLISLITGVTVASICAYAFHFTPLTVAVIALAVVLATYAEGSYRVWARTAESRDALSEEKRRLEAQPPSIVSGQFAGNTFKDITADGVGGDVFNISFGVGAQEEEAPLSRLIRQFQAEGDRIAEAIARAEDPQEPKVLSALNAWNKETYRELGALDERLAKFYLSDDQLPNHDDRIGPYLDNRLTRLRQLLEQQSRGH